MKATKINNGNNIGRVIANVDSNLVVRSQDFNNLVDDVAEDKAAILALQTTDASDLTLTQVKADTDIASAISLKHSHTNKTVLDAITTAPLLAASGLASDSIITTAGTFTVVNGQITAFTPAG